MRDFAGTLYSDVHDRVPLGLRRRKCCGRCLSSARTAIDNVMSANGTSNSQEASETARVAWPLQLSHSIPFRSCLTGYSRGFGQRLSSVWIRRHRGRTSAGCRMPGKERL